MRKEEDLKPKIGAGHASAMLRQGLRELRATLYPESNVSHQAEYGIYGTRTPGEVAESRRQDGREMEEEPPGGGVLADRLQVADRSRSNQVREDKSLERE